MKTLSARFKGNRLVELSEDVDLPENLEVLVIVPEQDEEREEAAWLELAIAHFLTGYSDADSVYDQL